MAANRRKTIEYALATRITPLATGTTLTAAVRHDTPSVTLFIPETAARSFLSVRLIASYRTQLAGSNAVTGYRLGIKLGAAAPSDTDRTLATVAGTRNVFDVVDVDVTGYFNASFGAAGSQTCVASLAVATTTAAAINGITFKLVITYELDATAAPTRIKTIRIPIQSQVGLLTAAHQEIGIDSVNPAPANQIPALDTFLPEAGKVYRQIVLESTANDANTAGTAAFTPFVQIDAASEIARATIDETQPTPLVWRDVLDLTGAIATSAPHALKLRSTLAARLQLANSTLVVTYEYSAAATTAVMCEAVIPLASSHDDGLGLATGASISVNVPGDAQALLAAIAIQEANPVLVQSAVYLNCMSHSGAATVQVRAGGQSYRPYATAGAVGDSPLVHRVDHGGGWTLRRGDNRLVLNVYNSVLGSCDVSGYALLNYVATAPADVDAATHVVNYLATTYGQAAANAVDVPASASGLRVPVLGAPYRILAVMVEQYGRATMGSLAPQLLLEQRAGEWDGAGFLATPLRHPGIAQVGSWRLTWPLTRAFNLDHLHTGKLNIETARRQIGWNVAVGWQAAWSWWITYHQLTFPVAGTVTIGGAPAANGKPVEIYARDNSNNVELVATTTTGANSGAFSVAVVDNTRSYFASYQDGTAQGRSPVGTPGTSTFHVEISRGASLLASASDVDARVVDSGEVEVTWFYPADITAQSVVFDVYQSDDATDLFRSAAATEVADLVVRLSAAGLAGARYVTVVARRGSALALPSRPAFVAVPWPSAAPTRTAIAAAVQGPTGLGFPFAIAPTGGVVAQGGDALLRGKILQLLLTSPGERVNRPDYGTRLLDLVFDPNSEVLAATMEFTITRALQQAFADEIQLDAVQLTTADDTLFVDISYLRKANLTLDQVRVGVPLPAGAAP